MTGLSRRRRDEGVRRRPVLDGVDLEAPRRDHRRARAVGLRQDHAAAAGRRLPAPRRRHDRARRPQVVGGASARPGARARGRLRPAGGCALPAPRRGRQHRVRAPARRAPVRPASRRVDEVLDLVELPAPVHRRVTRTSSRAASSSGWRWPGRWRPQPAVVLLDEPFSSLDAGLREDTGRAVVRALRASGATAVLVTHDQGEALSLADQVAVMRAGRFLQVAAPAELYLAPARPRSPRFVGHATPARAARPPDGMATCALGKVPVADRRSRGAVLLAIRPEQSWRRHGCAGGRGDGDRGQLLRPRRDVRARSAPTAAWSSRASRPVRCPGPGDLVSPRRRRPGASAFPTPRRRHGDEPSSSTPAPCRAHPLLGGAGPTRPCAGDRRSVDGDVRRPRPPGRGAPGPSSAPTRRLVLLEAANDVERVVTYLAALAGGTRCCSRSGVGTTADATISLRPTTPTSSNASAATMRGACAPAAATTCTPTSRSCSARPARPARPSWCGSPATTCVANARSIAEYLAHPRRPTGRSPRCRCTTATACRCCNSHLGRGAAVVLTDLSVVDACFWDLVGAAGVTTLRRRALHLRPAGRAAGFADRDLPDAAARSPRPAAGWPPSGCATYAELGRARGWDLVVMYGQTEATARMAYLPPDLAAARPARSASRSPAAPAARAGRRGRPDPASASSSTPAPT